MFRKYLVGQHILFITAKEKAWIGRHEERQHDCSETEKTIVKVLRSNAGGVITVDAVANVDIAVKRALRNRGTYSYLEACEHVKAMFAHMVDTGIGERVECRLATAYHPDQKWR